MSTTAVEDIDSLTSSQAVARADLCAADVEFCRKLVINPPEPRLPRRRNWSRVLNFISLFLSLSLRVQRLIRKDWGVLFWRRESHFFRCRRRVNFIWLTGTAFFSQAEMESMETFFLVFFAFYAHLRKISQRWKRTITCWSPSVTLLQWKRYVCCEAGYEIRTVVNLC